MSFFTKEIRNIVCICQRMSSCIKLITHSLNGAVAKFDDSKLIKIQHDIDAYRYYDLLIQDALMMSAVKHYPQPDKEKKYLLTPENDNGQYIVDFETKNVFRYMHPDEPNVQCISRDYLLEQALYPHLARPCLSFTPVPQPLSLVEVLFALKDHDQKPYQTLIGKLNFLFQILTDLASATGFSHGDLHAGNILWNLTGSRFVLIDYGRAYIDPQFIPANIIQSLTVSDFLKGIKSNETAFKRFYKMYKIDGVEYPILSYQTKVTPADAKTEDQKSFMMWLDIGSLCFYIYQLNPGKIHQMYPNTKTVFLLDFLDGPKGRVVKSIDCNYTNVKQYEPNSYFEAGLKLFYECMGWINTFCLYNRQPLLDFNLLQSRGHLYIVNMLVNPETALYYYKMTFTEENALKNAMQSANAIPVTKSGGNVSKPRDQDIEAFVHGLETEDPWERIYAIKQALTQVDWIEPIFKNKNQKTMLPVMKASLIDRKRLKHTLTPIHLRTGITIPDRAFNSQTHQAPVPATGGTSKTRYVQLHGKKTHSRVYKDIQNKPFIKLHGTTVFLSSIKGKYRNV
jgi:hypothetical protein